MDFGVVMDGSNVHVEFGEVIVVSDPTDAHSIQRSFLLTYGQSLVHLSSLSGISSNDTAQVIKDLPVRLFPIWVGIVFCGRQSPGGHNVICGLRDAIKSHNPKSTLIGFCVASHLWGTEGLFSKQTIEITEGIVSTYRNQGGYDMLGRTKDQIRTSEQVKSALDACQALKVDGLVIIGGVLSNTDAAQLAETFANAKCQTKVIGVPVTLYGDLKNQFVEANVGFDTICKVNSQLISNLCTDALSAEKYYYFIRLLGRRASHVALECTLQSHPNMVILSEEIAASNLTLFDITKRICDAVQARAEQDKYHGVILLPEGLIESIPEVHTLLQEILALHKKGVPVDSISAQLSPCASALFEFLPPYIRVQLLLSPKSDDSAQSSQIETEKLLAQLVETEMNTRTVRESCTALCHHKMGHTQGRSLVQFPISLGIKLEVLGHVSYHLLAAGVNGYMATVTNLKDPVSRWCCGGAPFTAMMAVKRLHGPGVSPIGKPSIHPAAVDLRGKPYKMLIQEPESFLMDDVYRNPGPIQFEGTGSEIKPISLCVEDQDYMGRVKELQNYLDMVKMIVKPGCSQEVLKAALSSMSSVVNILSIMSVPSKGQASL
ncbi:hypothetical protein MKX01_031776 [Papaver californicum]|nr:hypothetical protein MKX01_031776 [Papaver californicum]